MCPAVAIRQLGPVIGEWGGAAPAVAPQQDAAPLYQLPLGPALRDGRLLCRERDTVTAKATRGHPGHLGRGHGGGGSPCTVTMTSCTATVFFFTRHL